MNQQGQNSGTPLRQDSGTPLQQDSGTPLAHPSTTPRYAHTGGLPLKQGMYDPSQEHDACGVGFVVNIRGEKSHQIVRSGLEILVNLTHRGACGCDPLTGDGAGILTQMPHAFFAAKAAEAGFELPPPGEYGIGTVFLPRTNDERLLVPGAARSDRGRRRAGRARLARRAGRQQRVGRTARDVEPFIRQIFIGRGKQTPLEMFEWKLYVIRKRFEVDVRASQLEQKLYCYVPSLSSRVIIYKGLLLADQVERFYHDLADERFVSALALVHQRYSTNTFPTWDLAHPFRFMAHNGEINTLKGTSTGCTRGKACWPIRSTVPTSKRFARSACRGASDSAVFDNALELLVLTGRSLPQAMSMLVPEPWQNHETMPDDLKAYYEYQACLIEPWDGPAAMAFTDGTLMGGVLDRNGLRPCRYWVTRSGMVVMASEAGVLDIPPGEVVAKGRLRPGKMFLVDTAQGRIIGDDEIKRSLSSHRPYRQWIREHQRRARRPAAGGAGQRTSRRAHAHTAAGLRLYARGSADLDAADGRRCRRGDRLDGQRHAAGGPLGSAAVALQLFQAIVRPGDQSAARCDSRGDHHLAGHDDRLRRQPARRNARAMPAVAARPADPDQHRPGAHSSNSTPARSKAARLSMLFPRKEGAAGMKRRLEELRREASQAIADGGGDSDPV